MSISKTIKHRLESAQTIKSIAELRSMLPKLTDNQLDEETRSNIANVMVECPVCEGMKRMCIPSLIGPGDAVADCYWCDGMGEVASKYDFAYSPMIEGIFFTSLGIDIRVLASGSNTGQDDQSKGRENAQG